MAKSRQALKLDEIGDWTVHKLDVIRRFAESYATIMRQQKWATFLYLDGFAGAGMHVDKETRELIDGSPVNVRPFEFHGFHLIDKNPLKTGMLHELVGDDPRVHIYTADSNELLLEQLLPQVTKLAKRRALLLLDPYGLHVDWRVIELAGQLGTIDLLLNFPMMDINRNVGRHDKSSVTDDSAARMTLFWGNDEWRNCVHDPKLELFGDGRKQPNEVIANAFKKRLRDVAGFAEVCEPKAFAETRSKSTIFYMYFASQKKVATKIAQHIFDHFGG